MQKAIIRRGETKDVPYILELIHQLAEYEKALHEVELTQEQLLVDGFGELPLYGLFVVEYQEEIIGFALYFYRYSTWKGKTLYLEDLYVKPDYRQEGIGARLFEILIKTAKEEKCRRMFWQVLAWNEPAMNFYKKIGADLDAEWTNGHLVIE
jgi:GNAT superfamily N-acetyltransferase